MRITLSVFIFLWTLISCQSNTASNTENASAASVSEVAASPADFQMQPDTIWLEGKFLPGCAIPGTIKVAEHNELNSPWRQATVNSNGEFKYAIYLTEPRRIALRTEKKASYDFMATTKEKVYKIEITCSNGYEKIELKGSAEEVPYRQFSNANKKFRSDVDDITKNDISKPEVFTQLKNTFIEYQKTLDGIATANPKSFTATFLCAAEKLPEGSLNSLESLRKNFLNREVFASPYLYNDFIGQRIIANYSSIRDKKVDPYETIDKLMKTGAKNQEAAKRLQQITYNIFYFRHEENLVTAYINWAANNAASMYNQSVKMQLQRLQNVIIGKQMIEVELKDPSGAPKKLSDVVKSGKLTLLIFYSPTCSHCQEEIPQIVPVWEANKNKGLKIYCAGFDATDAEWDWFIKNKASTEWTHVFEPSDGSPPSSRYVVNYTPTFILINKEGKIVSRFADIDYVKNELPKLLN